MLYNSELKAISPSDWPSNIKITATIGPVSASVEILEKMIDNGLTVARLNFSHGTHEYHASLIKNIRQASQNKGRNISIMLDTKGPEIRTGKLQQPSYTLQQNSKLILSMDYAFVGTQNKICVSHPALYKEVKKGDMIFIDDGLIRLKVDSIDIDKKEIVTTIENTAELKETKGVNVPGVDISLPVLTDKDKSDLLFGVEHNVDFIAASFIQRPEDVTHIKEFIKTKDILIYSKVECQSAVDNFDAILDESDGIMIARGDLGIEVPLTHVIELQKRFTKKCIEKRKPVIVATQMLQSMTVNPLPTRAEVSDVYNAVMDGNDCVMLSGESASGKYPVDSVRLQCEISNVASKRGGVMERFVLVESEIHCLDDYQKVVDIVKKEESNCLVVTMFSKLGRWLNLVKNCYVIVVNSAEELHEVSKMTVEHNSKAERSQT